MKWREKGRRLVRPSSPLLWSVLSISRLSLQPWLESQCKANRECVLAVVHARLCMWLFTCVCTCRFLCVFFCTVQICMHMHSRVHVRARVCQVRPWCPYAVTSPSTRQQPKPLHSSILHCHLKKPITSSPSDSHRPLVHIKRPIYTDPLSLKLFFKGKILFCALLVSKARQHSRESTTYIKVTQEQEDTLKRVWAEKKDNTFSMNYFGMFGCSYFCLLNLNSVTLCQATPRLPFNWVWHVSHLRLTLPMYKHGVHPSQRKLWKI